MKQIFFLHSAGPQEKPTDGSYGFVEHLKKSLPDFRIIHPLMPSPDKPNYKAWCSRLREELSPLKGELILIGHSLGGSVLLKFLSEEEIQSSVAGFYMVSAPYWGVGGWNAEEFILKKDFIKSLPPLGAIQIYHSKNDPHVPFAHAGFYAKALPDSVLHAIPGEDHAFQKGLPQIVKDLTTC